MCLTNDGLNMNEVFKYKTPNKEIKLLLEQKLLPRSFMKCSRNRISRSLVMNEKRGKVHELKAR